MKSVERTAENPNQNDLKVSLVQNNQSHNLNLEHLLKRNRIFFHMLHNLRSNNSTPTTIIVFPLHPPLSLLLTPRSLLLLALKKHKKPNVLFDTLKDISEMLTQHSTASIISECKRLI